ncbi:MAG: L,D-transpeptidase family protein [Methyloceanibacter sp.]|uniref:L,D-transpeptidase family protein n=1 Tax=Methyloceanibacter sp. TaxID=1965321 RepID=UPI003EE13A23
MTAGVSAAAVSPEIADNSEATAVVGTASAASVALALSAPEPKEAASETQAPETETAAMEPAAEDDSSEALETVEAAPEEDAEAVAATVSDDEVKSTEPVSADEPDKTTELTETAESAEASAETAEAPAPQDSKDAQDTDDPAEEVEPVETAETEADADEADAEAAGAVETAESDAQPEVTADTEPAVTDADDETAMADGSDESDEDSRPTEAKQGDIEDDETPADTAETASTEPKEDETPAEIAAVAPPATETPENAEDETSATAMEETEPAAIETAKIEEVADPEEAAEPAEAPEQAKTPPYDASVVLDVSPPPDEVLAAVVTPAADITPPKDEEEETKIAALTPPSAPVPEPEAKEEETSTAEALDTAPSEDEKVEAEDAPAEDSSTEDSSTEDSPADDASADADAQTESAADEDEASNNNQASSEETAETPSEEEAVAEEAGPPPPPPAHPVVAAIRAKLEEPGQYKSAAASDLKALTELYGAREEPPLWITDSGFSDKAKAIMAEIRKADDWALQASSFELPAADAAPATEDAQADAEIKLSIAILSYARDAQIGRLSPSQVSKLFDQHPTLRDPKTVLTEMAGSDAPDKYLLSLHPQHVPFKRLQEALVRARDSANATGRRPEDDRKVQLIVINMERWRWLPRQLGNYHVWNNVPEFNVRVIKGSQVIYQEKTIVGQHKYATPFFSAPMRNIVFHPNWTVPPTIIKEDLAPKLKGPSGGGFFGNSKDAILRRYGLAVSYKGERISADTVDWDNVNIHAYTFTQEPGPANVLGQFKFNFPNKHAIYMHDTPQRELFAERTRTLSHGCIRVNQPDRLAALLLGEDKGWSINQVRSLVAKGPDSSTVISLNRHVPVHLTYFTAMADQDGTVSDFGDIYGIDNRMASKLFSNPAHFPVPPTPEVAESGSSSRAQAQSQRQRSGGGFDSFISGIFGN